MIRNLSLILLAAAAASAGCQKEQEDSKSPVDETPKQLPATAEVLIASVSMVEDCPDAEPAADPAAEAKPEANEAKRSAEARGMRVPAPEAEAPAVEGDSEYGYEAPCRQSFMQLAITGQGERSFKFAVAQVRVLDGTGAKLGTVKTRLPTIWKSEGYAAWDEMVMPVNPVKASYKVSMPTWDDSSKRVGGGNYGAAYMLEADVMIDGVSKTVRSAPVVPEPPEMVET